MPDGIVELGQFQDEPSAWLARAELEANGIPSQVVNPYPYPYPGLVPIRLAVREEDADAAARILKAASERTSA